MMYVTDVTLIETDWLEKHLDALAMESSESLSETLAQLKVAFLRKQLIYNN